MDIKMRLGAAFVLALIVSMSINPFGLVLVSAATSPGAMQAERMQPPPQAPSEPPPGSGPGSAPPAEPYEPPTEPETPTEPQAPSSDEDFPEDSESGEAPQMPQGAPAQSVPLPDPADEGGVWDAEPSGEGEPVFRVTAFGDLSVSVDRGCGATYYEGESIVFSASGDWEVFDFNTEWWRYLEVWSSTNGAWWQQIVPGRWVEPRQSVSRSGWIAAPVGEERLYARYLDQFGNVLAEANCYYTSAQEETPPPDTGAWLECGDTVGGYVLDGNADEWYFAGSAGTRVTIFMVGYNGFDTYLKLYDPNDRFLREHDDISRSNTNSRLRQTLGRSGVYTIVAHGYDYREGSYDLLLTCN